MLTATIAFGMLAFSAGLPLLWFVVLAKTIWRASGQAGLGFIRK